MRIANKNARYYVERLIPFRGSHLYARLQTGGIYVVYSYGEHWPLILNQNSHWYITQDRYSRSTSRHRSQCAPLGQPIIPITMNQMKAKLQAALYGPVTLT